ncbi:hypothetical protein NDK47_13170 [Brevibacillus ruminantium]|uniref:DUF4367 domain-containing protein n=1 Tax=Brevibacillus ruminantium TaxID=2950604 RepID=A0ABY4WQM2_9BACL|nr:DUF4367 domain-containing protein [Brevibacillus ruminantium]USG68170.1 hypothetical protein NDK47_13170 [Brevibacillus ruminantium]
MLLLVSTAYAAVQVFQLRDENGNVSYQARQGNEQEITQLQKPDTEMVQQQMSTQDDLAAFSIEVEGFATIPEKLTDSFVFTKGDIFYEGTERKKEKIKTANAFYQGDSGKIILIIKKADPQEIVYAMPATMEKIAIDKKEGVYKEIKSSTGNELKQLTWVNGDMLYSLQSADVNVTKSTLIHIAEKLE